MKHAFLALGIFAITVTCSAACSSSSAPAGGTGTTCPTSGAVAPGGYGCDITFANDDHANMCLSPLHYEASEIFTVLQTKGDELSLDAWEPKGAQRSMYLVLMNSAPPFKTGDRAGINDASGNVSAVLTLSLNPTPDGMVQFEAASGAFTLTKVDKGDFTITGSDIPMVPRVDPLANVKATGKYTASVACHINAN